LTRDGKQPIDHLRQVLSRMTDSTTSTAFVASSPSSMSAKGSS